MTMTKMNGILIPYLFIAGMQLFEKIVFSNLEQI